MSWFNRFSNLFRRDELNRELDEELQFHLDARTSDNLQAGMTTEAARHDAGVRLGNRTLAKERMHEANILAGIATTAQDIRYALRSLRRSPGFTALAILALALGIGANTAVFTVVNGVLLRPLSFDNAERVFLISYRQPSSPFASVPGLDDQQYLEFKKRTRAFERVATFGGESVTLTGAGDALRVPAALVTPGFFSVLRVNPAMGRTFAEGEDRAQAALLGDELWHGRFQADPDIVGKRIAVDGIARTVIGVMPAGFAFPNDAGLWLPLDVAADPGNIYFRPCIGRLRPDVSPQQALAELNTLVPALPVWQRADRNTMTAEVLPLKELLVGDIRNSLLVFLAAVAFVLLIACANVANLLLMRGSLRRQEMAVRTALGANRPRLIRQLLTESTLISFAGAAAGMLLAVFGVQALLSLAPPGKVPRIEEIHMDGRVLGVRHRTRGIDGNSLRPAARPAGHRPRTARLSGAGRTRLHRPARRHTGCAGCGRNRPHPGAARRRRPAAEKLLYECARWIPASVPKT